MILVVANLWYMVYDLPRIEKGGVKRDPIANDIKTPGSFCQENTITSANDPERSTLRLKNSRCL